MKKKFVPFIILVCALILAEIIVCAVFLINRNTDISIAKSDKTSTESEESSKTSKSSKKDKNDSLSKNDKSDDEKTEEADDENDKSEIDDSSREKKKVMETHYDADGNLCYYKDYEYDNYGNVIYIGLRNEDGVYRENKYEYVYDESGNIITKTLYAGEVNDLELWESEEYGYDHQGNLTKYISQDDDVYYVYEYDNNGKMKYKISYNDDGCILSSSEYDVQGNETKYICYQELNELHGNIRYSYECEYDGKGNMTKKTYYDADGNLYDLWDMAIIEYTYE